MASIDQVRSKLLSLLELRNKLAYELQLKDADFEKIKTERIKIEADRVEKYAEMLAKDRKLEEIRLKLHENETKIEELEKSTLECRKTSELLSTKIDKQDELINQLQLKAEEAQGQTLSSGKTYSETLDRFRDMQTASERVERREAQLNVMLRELDQDKSSVETKLKRLESMEVEASRRQSSLVKSIEEYNERLKSANERAADAEAAYEGLSVELALLQEEANDWTLKTRTLNNQLETVRVSIQAT